MMIAAAIMTKIGTMNTIGVAGGGSFLTSLGFVTGIGVSFVTGIDTSFFTKHMVVGRRICAKNT